MSSNVTLNGVQYVIPAYNDTGWAQGAGNLSLYLAAIASNTLQPTGGAFTLTSELDFGANFGVKQLYLKTETANPASAGVVRLASADAIKWRNNANGADIALSKDSSDNLQYNATKVLLSGAVVNADINSAAAIAYSKLALTGSIVNADVNASAAIAYSKLALTGSIVNGDLVAGTLLNTAINASAGIARSKMAALTVSRAMVTDGSGFDAVSATTATELGYVSGVTSAIQTQLNGKQASGTYIANPAVASISFSPTTLGIVGTTTNDAATAGNVGEYITSAFSAVAGPSTGQYGDATSISLTAGDWDVSYLCECFNTTFSVILAGVGTVTGNNSTGTGGTNNTGGAIATSDYILSMGGYRLSVSGTTTYYLKVSGTFGSGTMKVSGRFSARRAR